MSDFTYYDLKSAFDFAKKNPDKSVDDFMDVRSKTLTKKEKDIFKDVKYFKIPITVKDEVCELYLFKGHSSLSNFTNKFVGNKSYYSFHPGMFYGYYLSIICIDTKFGETSNWNDYEDLKGVKFLENKDLGIMIFYDNIIDDDFNNDSDKYQLFFDKKSEMSRKNYHFWNSNSRVDIFLMKEIGNFDFNPISELFNN